METLHYLATESSLFLRIVFYACILIYAVSAIYSLYALTNELVDDRKTNKSFFELLRICGLYVLCLVPLVNTVLLILVYLTYLNYRRY